MAREQKKQREQVQKEKEKEKEQQAAAAEAAKVAETTTQLHRSTTTATHAEPELSTASITTAGPVPTTPQAPAMATIATATATPINHALPVQLFTPSTDSYGSYHSALAAAVEYLLTDGKGQAEFKKIEGIWGQYKEGTPQKQRYGNIVGLVRYRRQEKKKLQEIVESASKKQKVN